MTIKFVVRFAAGCALLLTGTPTMAKDNWAYCYGVHNNAAIYLTQVFAVPGNAAERDLPNNYERLLRAKYKRDGAYQIKCYTNTDTSALEQSKKKIENYAQANRITALVTAAPVDAGSNSTTAPVASTSTEASKPTPVAASHTREKTANQSSLRDHIYCYSFIDQTKPGGREPEFYVSPFFAVTHNTPGGRWWPSVFSDVKQQWEAAVQRHNPRSVPSVCSHFESDQAARGKAERDGQIRRMSQPPNGTHPIAVRHLDWTYRQ